MDLSSTTIGMPPGVFVEVVLQGLSLSVVTDARLKPCQCHCCVLLLQAPEAEAAAAEPTAEDTAAANGDAAAEGAAAAAEQE